MMFSGRIAIVRGLIAISPYVLLLAALIMVMPVTVSAETTIDRCQRYYPQIIKEARFFGGETAPAHEFMAQIEIESRCNEGITAFDGGMGLGQFMPQTADWIHGQKQALRALSDKPAPYDPRWAIRALVLYDLDLYRQALCPAWWAAYRAYNGGLGNINREIQRAGSCDPAIVARHCQRKVIPVKGGTLDLCKINTEYPAKIVRAGQKYLRD